ncbi:Na(+)/H(+) exchanger protein 2-like isoform X1 [Portunus trituberculatus]|uniref:Na(+)/H(+) exchanger protein 2-like isoform X1 n=1 Tax=Portunus trituberculatus TaxID=210409 RepID=UPI001E1CB01E|nr:Na(+)/H(+) exchanger protein 2-like isoform X1 [Portunus trituberculatus]
MKTRVLLLLCAVWCCGGLTAVVTASTPTREHHTGTTTLEPRNETVGRVRGDEAAVRSEGEGGHGIERYPVAVIDFERVQNPFIIGLWIFLACLGKIGFHMTPKISHVFPESCMLIVLGVVIGVLLIYTQAATVSPLTADVFFLYLLPPIILDAGYFMPNRLFFDNLFTILVFAVVGTIWNALTIGITMYAISLTGLFGVNIPMLHMFLFSSLISAVDPVAVLAVFEEIQVEEVLYILVFGESLLNDGVTVVLYHLFEGFSELGEENIMAVDIASGVASFLLVALGGTAIGIIWGFLTAFVTRLTREVRVIEPIFVFVMSYLAYLNAEIFHLSGILSITFCGITMKNYVEQNISTKSHTTIKYAMKMLASSSETVIFMFLGVSTIQSTHDWNTWFVILTILFCSVYRIFGVVIFSAVCNRFRVKKIGFVDKFVMSYGGLRGAVAFALVITINIDHIPLQPMFLTATIAMVYFTVFVQGITIKPLVQLLGVKKSEKRQLTMNERLHERVMDYLMSGIEDVLGKQGHLLIRNKFKRFNNKYLTPFLVRDKNVIEPKLLETYSNIKMHEAMEQMHNSYNSPQNIESFSNLLRNAASHPHVQRNNQGEWNLDVAELDYNPTLRDINDAKFHHLLSNDYRPVKKSRGSTYKRHAVKDDDMQTQSDIGHHNMYLHTRQFVENDKRLHKKAKKMGLVAVRKERGVSPHHVPTSPLSQGSGDQEFASQGENGVVKTPQDHRAAYQQNGSAIKLKQDYIARVIQDNPAFVNDDGTPMFPDQQTITEKRRQSTKGPTMAEIALPWKRYYQDGEPQDPRRLQRALSIVNSEEDGSQPTLAEAVLPWKRPEDEEVCQMPVKQNEFPAWASNKEYVNYYSPSNTFLGKLGRHDSYPNIREIFERRNSSSSIKSRRGSLKEHPMPLRERSASRGSIDVPCTSTGATNTTTTTHDPSIPHLVRQRTSTDCSLLNTTIVEEDRRPDTVIDINPSGTEAEQTHM